jgi:hypothetical protein
MNEDEVAVWSLPRERPAGALEQRIARELRRQGLLRSRRSWRRIAAAAALILLGAIGGRVWPRETVHPNYVLLVHEDAAPAAPGENRAREYGAWMHRSKGLVGGEELSDRRQIVSNIGLRSGSAARDRAVGGYFLLSAASEQQAISVAQTCPHLRHGGSLELRLIEQH